MEVHRLVVRSNGAIVGGAQLIVRRLRPLGATAYIPYGPVVALDNAPKTAALLATSIKAYCHDVAIRALRTTARRR